MSLHFLLLFLDSEKLSSFINVNVMKLKLYFLFSVFPILFWTSIFVSPVAGQGPDISKALAGEWRGPRASYQGKTYSLTVVFSRESGKLQAFVDPNINLNNEKGLRFYPATDLKLSENRLTLSIEGSRMIFFYEGELSPDGKNLTMHFSYELPSEPDSRITWNLKKVPLCNDPEEISAAVKSIWEHGNYREVQELLPGCLPVNLFEDKNFLLSGLVILKGGDFVRDRYRSYTTEQRYDAALSHLNKSLTLNSENPIAHYAVASIHYERALGYVERMNALTESNNKLPPELRRSASLLDAAKKAEQRVALSFFSWSLGSYDSIIARDAFDTTAYVKRAQTYYAAWSKCDPNPDFLDNALKDYKSAIELSPLSYELFYERAQIYKFLGDMEKYEADMKQVAELKVNK